MDTAINSSGQFGPRPVESPVGTFCGLTPVQTVLKLEALSVIGSIPGAIRFGGRRSARPGAYPWAGFGSPGKLSDGAFSAKNGRLAREGSALYGISPGEEPVWGRFFFDWQYKVLIPIYRTGALISK